MRTNTNTAAALVNPQFISTLDEQINVQRAGLAKLEQARELLVGREPAIAVTRGRSGRKRRFQADSSSSQTTTGGDTKRKRGRPKGSKNKPKVAVSVEKEPATSGSTSSNG
jgi:hypothetical protein